MTANLTFGGLDLPEERPFVPTVKELFREGISMHTCDRRSTKTYIQNLFPGYAFEDGFTEEDELWRGSEAETPAAQAARTKTVLDDVFRSDDRVWVSITSHSGEIANMLSVLGHRPFRLATGQVIPVLVKARRMGDADVPPTSLGPWTSQPTCNSPPATVEPNGDCVCPTGSPTPTSVASAPTPSA